MSSLSGDSSRESCIEIYPGCSNGEFHREDLFLKFVWKQLVASLSHHSHFAGKKKGEDQGQRVSSQNDHVVAMHSGKQTLRKTVQIVEYSLLYWEPKAESLLSQGPQPTFVKTLYTLSVLLKPTSPDSLNLAWKVLKGDTIKLQPWFILRRVSWFCIVAYTNACPKDLQRWLTTQGIITFFLVTGNLDMESGVYQSGRPVRPWVCYPHSYQAHGPKLTESARWSCLLFQDEVNLVCSFPPSTKGHLPMNM